MSAAGLLMVKVSYLDALSTWELVVKDRSEVPVELKVSSDRPYRPRMDLLPEAVVGLELW